MQENKLPNSTLEEFEKQLKNNFNKKLPSPKVEQPKTVTVTKNIVCSFASDATGCGHIRNIFPMTYLNSLFGKTQQLITLVSPFFLFQNDILARSCALYFQRQMSPQHLEVLKQYKKAQEQFKFKMVYDIDDYIWGKNEDQGGDKFDGVPTYNFGCTGITDEIKSSSVEIMNLMDECLFSTQFLADYAKNVLGVKPKCTVVPNVLPMYFWGNGMKPDIQTEIKKPKVVYNGSPTHYHNGKKLLGDFDNAWKDWIIEAVNNDEIEFSILGGLPWFLEEIKDKITIYNWVGSFDYHTLLKNIRPDIGIMPLVPNNFNYGKSDIKYLEFIAVGCPTIGTVFTNGNPSPYDVCQETLTDTCTVQQIKDRIKSICSPDHYNKVKNAQYQWMRDNGRWMEDPKYINLMLKILKTR
jgi:hypothetical protein